MKLLTKDMLMSIEKTCVRPRVASRASIVLAIGILGLALTLPSRGQEKQLISTVKPSLPSEERHTRIQGNKFSSSATTVQDLIRFAYSVHASQIVGAPEWSAIDKFDTVVDEEAHDRPTPEELRKMVAEMLADRFKLRLLHSRQVLPIFALGRNGSKIRLPKDDAPDTYLSGGLTAPGTFFVGHGTLGDFARYLGRFAPDLIDRPVVDQTGIAGLYDFTLHFRPSATKGEIQSPEFNPNDDLPDLFTAIREQLGLKLTAEKGEVDVLRVESLSPPDPN